MVAPETPLAHPLHPHAPLATLAREVLKPAQLSSALGLHSLWCPGLEDSSPSFSFLSFSFFLIFIVIQLQ